MKTALEPNEVITRSSWANLFRGWEGVGGRLYLTDRRLVFESHAINFQTGTNELPVCEIAGAKKCWSKFLGVPLAPTSVVVAMKSGEEFQFVLYFRQTWIDAILGARDRAARAGSAPNPGMPQ